LLWLVRYPPLPSSPPNITTNPPPFSPNRGLDFTALALRHNLSHPTEELSLSFRHSYTQTLKPHHSFLVKPVFSAAMGATPYKKDFYAKMGERREDVDGRLEGWLGSLEMQVGVLKGFLGRKEAKW